MTSISKWRLFVIFSFAFCNTGEGSKELIVKMSTKFQAAMEHCSKELNLQAHIFEAFQNFWQEDYDLVHREMGCALMCMAGQHELISEDYKLHHDKTHEFAKNHGADDDTAKQIVTIIHDCEKGTESEADHCMRALNIAKCFRSKMHELKWAPSIEDFMGEVMADM